MRYVALLKGINVGRSKRIAMSDLRALLTGLGYEDVATYLASGNALFTTSNLKPAVLLAAEIEQRITAELQMVVRVIVRNGGELSSVIARNPLAADPENPSRFFVGFLEREAESLGRARRRERATSERSSRRRDLVEGRRGVLVVPGRVLAAGPRRRDRKAPRSGGDDAHVEHGHESGPEARFLSRSP